MNYILNKDYSVTIRREVEAIVSQYSQDVKNEAELIAVSLASGYLANRYDTAAIFVDISTYNNAAQYTAGDIVTNSDEDGTAANYTALVYVALVDNTGALLSNDSIWKKTDPRNKALVSRVIDIALYEMHCSINPRNIPTLRETRYDAAIKWLEKVAMGEIKLDLPLLKDEDGEEIPTFRGSSNEKYSERY